MFFIVLREKLVSTTIQIVSVDNLYIELSLTYNYNISSLRIYMQVIITLLQQFIILIEDCFILPPAHKVLN